VGLTRTENVRNAHVILLRSISLAQPLECRIKRQDDTDAGLQGIY
jgi:hypothetical protein